LRLSSKGTDEKELKKGLDNKMDQLVVLLKDIAIGFEEETSIEERIGALLVQRGHTVSLAESCTGGLIASKITSHAGASAYFKGALVAYDTKIKSEVLGVSFDLIKNHNVVSVAVAEEMATQSKKLFGTEYAIATTGIAGPTKGDGEDEVGTVCIAVSTPSEVISEKFSFGKARERVIMKSTNKAMELLLKEILKN
jgi:nicotinamide-nucleotide amidase